MRKAIIFILLFHLSLFVISQNQRGVIPLPVKTVFQKSDLVIGSIFTVLVKDDTTKETVHQFNDFLSAYYGFKLGFTTDERETKGKILIRKIYNKTKGYYELKVENENIYIKGDNEGVFYAFQTLKQLIKPHGKQFVSVPYCTIEDYPRFAWRGMHLDVSRHFVTIDSIKQYIDYLALYKMNRFHWHLTDDQGWRIEIKKYPKLTEVGGYRKGTLIGSYQTYPHTYDTIRYGGYYTQEEVKEVVDYAKKRFITIVPEIEMPGHSMAALSAYPEFSCRGDKLDVSKTWGVFDDVFCAKDSTILFLTDILNEVMGLFPGDYIHVGGDECPKTRWKECNTCQDIMSREGLKDENELQSYFIKRIEKVIEAKGKKLIGWDEILEGGLAPNAAVMSWRGTEGGIEAAKQKHYVVMTPGSHCYFDHYQGSPISEPLAIGGYTTVEKVYSYEPIPEELNSDEQKYILGAQANVWTEYIPTFKKVEYMVFPRICALSEVLWSEPKSKNWMNFRTRLLDHFYFLDKLKINYSKSIFELKSEVKPVANDISLKLSSEIPVDNIFYTLDNSIPDISSFKYTDEIRLKSNATIKAAGFENGVRRSPIYEQSFVFSKSTGKEVKLSVQPHKSYNHGGSFTLVDGIMGRIPWYGKEWLGFLNDEVEITINLASPDTISEVRVDLLEAKSSWIYLPRKIDVMLSPDDLYYYVASEVGEKEITQAGRSVRLSFKKSSAKYVKVRITNSGIIPENFPGSGNKAWLFIDEIQIY